MNDVKYMVEGNYPVSGMEKRVDHVQITVVNILSSTIGTFIKISPLKINTVAVESVDRH